MPRAESASRRRAGQGGVTTLLAVDGGASKVDIAIVDTSGRLLAAARRPGSYHFGLDHDSPIETLAGALGSVPRPWADGARQLADVGVYCLAGADIPIDDRRIAAQVVSRGWTSRTVIRNDTFAVLRAGTDRTWGVGVVCGTGLNCAAVSPEGRIVRCLLYTSDAADE